MAKTLTEALYENGTLIAVRIGRWAAQKKIGKDDIFLDEEVKDDGKVLYPGHIKLLPPKADKDIGDIEHNARKFINGLTTPFLGFDGIRYTKLTSMPSILKELPVFQAAFMEKVEAMLHEYPSLRATQQAEIDKFFDERVTDTLKKVKPENVADKDPQIRARAAERKAFFKACYPETNRLRSSFQFTWRLFQLVPGQNIQGAGAGELEKDLVAWMKTSTAETHLTLGGVVSNAKEILQTHSSLPPRSLKPLYEALVNFEAQDITSSSPFLEPVRRLRRAFPMANGGPNYTALAESLKLDSERYMFNELLSALSPLALQETAEKAGRSSIEGAEALRRFVEY